MGKGTTQTTKENSNTNQQQQSYSPTYVQDAAKNLVATGTGMTAPFLQIPNYGVAGFTPDQLAAFDFTRNIAQQRGENTYKWFQGAREYVGDATYQPTAGYNASSFAEFMNPFQSQVIDATRATLDRDYRDRDAMLAAKYAAAGTFGGSGEALARGQAARAHGENLANITAQLNSQAFNTAAGLAYQKSQIEQQQAAAAAASEDTRRARGMQGLQMGSALESEDLQRQLLGLQALMGSGQQQQDLANQALQWPWGALSILAGLTPQDQTMMSFGQSASSGTKKTESSGGGSLLSGLMGLASLPMGGGTSLGGAVLGKAFGIGCDRAMKTDIEEIGVDEEAGLKLYAFRYKSDPKTYPKVVAPMSDEVEERFPGSTRLVAGKRIIRADRLAA